KTRMGEPPRVSRTDGTEQRARTAVRARATRARSRLARGATTSASVRRREPSTRSIGGKPAITLASVTVTPSTWSPSSWRSYDVLHRPDWPAGSAVEAAVERLRSMPPLVFAGEARALTAALGEVAAGRAFL